MRLLFSASSALTRRLASSSAKPRSPLALLRKRTGFSISKCKEALVKHGNDLLTAEKWLHETAQREGWARAEQLSGRMTRQGLIGAVVQGNHAAMVEVNCETDFVARNLDFQDLVSRVVNTSLSTVTTIPAAPESLSVQFQDATELNSLAASNGRHHTLKDLIAEGIGHFGENIVISRGCVMSTVRGAIVSYVYNNSKSGGGMDVGSYATLLHLLPSGSSSLDPELVASLGQRLGQHIIGMNPRAIHPGNEAGDRSEESALVTQPLLSDSSVKVGEWLESHNLQVTEFVRYALGETQD